MSTATPVTSGTPKLFTAEEFANLPEPPDGSRQELVRGVIIVMPPPRFRHGQIQGRTYSLLDTYVTPLKLGRVVPETGLITQRGPDSVRGPDVSFWSAERLPLDVMPEVYPEVAADLCVEVRSPGETLRKILEKLREYFACGVRMVWIIDPEERNVTVYRTPDEGRVLWENAILSGEDVIPGFSCRVADIFA